MRGGFAEIAVQICIDRKIISILSIGPMVVKLMNDADYVGVGGESVNMPR